ncbi:MAG: ABC transporter permease [Clostridium sp.]|nr:ABC transporter permease [Clostridium sp.]MCM1398497.1 ABC transporter permease [Clostridium sp.]MCM1460219.1 ABC transporter permease [Bacteroides sp.]
MMHCKLALRNIKKSIKDYIIYFATLILGIAIFYVFNAIDSQSSMLILKETQHDVITLMTDVLSVVSVFVAFVLGFLIVYASNFLMKHRKKEFAVYMLLGMSKRSISAVIVVETVLIGLISLLVGLGLGIAASQGMSVIIASLFEADMTAFRFTVSSQAIVKTLLYFLVMYGIVIVCDVFVVGKERLINLLHSGKRAEKNYAKNPVLCVLVFAVACVLLGTAYYNVTAGVENISSMGYLGIQVVKGIIGTFMAFWSVSGMMMICAEKSKRFYFKGLNAFSVKELGNRINSNVFSGGIICLLLFFTICILSCSMAVKSSLNSTLRKNVQADVQMTAYQADLNGRTGSIVECLEKNNVDMSKFSDWSEISIYYIDGASAEELLKDTKYKADYLDLFDIVTQSDYNKLAHTYGRAEVSVGDDEYILLANYSFVSDKYDVALENGAVLDICGRTYRPKYDKCERISLVIEAEEANAGVLIVPDSCNPEAYVKEHPQEPPGMHILFTANYANMSDSERDEWDEYMLNGKFKELADFGYISSDTRMRIYDASIGLTVLFVFTGSYLGLVFLISAAAILALKELSNASDNQGKYLVLRKIGVDEKMINRSLLGQSALFFGLPLGLAVIHSIFGIQVGTFMLAAFSRDGLTGAIIFSAAIILLIYLLYFAVTYLCSKEIIKNSRN